MPLTLQQFREQVVFIGVVPDVELDTLCAKLGEVEPGKQAEQLARGLVRAKKLTAFQAQQCYAGKARGLVLGDYLIQDKIGQGGMGMVFKAEHRRMERVVAIKVLSPSVTNSPDALQRFQREVKAAAKLNHPNIVTAYDAGEANGTHFLVIEFVEGKDLSAIVRERGRLSLDQAIACTLQAAQGLEYAHRRGIVHRDIKPANVLLDDEGKVQILDMGLARIDTDDEDVSSQLTGTGQIMGTFDFMAPEQAVDTRTVDARADIYSLGVTLFYLATGRVMYDGDSIVKKLLAHQTAVIPSLCDACPEASPQLQAVFAKMVAKTPETRYQTMTEVIDDLRECIGEEPASFSVPMKRGELTQFNSFLRHDGESSQPVTIVSPSQTVPHEIAATVDIQSSELDTQPHTATFIATEPSPKTSPKRSKSSAPRVVKYIATGVLSLLVLAGVIVVIKNKDGSETRIELPEGATASIIENKPDVNPPDDAKPKVDTENGWSELFNGSDTSAWSTLGPFEVRDGTLVANGKEGNAVSRDQFSDFELEAEWKVGPAGNGGIYYRELPVTKAAAGNEYQMLDDAAYAAKQPANMTTGSIYGLIAPSSKAARPIGEWNRARIVCNGTIVEHWLNDQKVVSYDTASDAWEKLIANSTWAGKTTVGVRPRGHLLLQGLGGEIAFKSIRIRQIASNPAISANAIPVLPPLAGSASLVSRPQFIPGLKSWDIARPFPVGWCTGIKRLSDGRFVTSCFIRPGIYVHGTDLQIQKVLMSPETFGSFGLAVAPDHGLAAEYLRDAGIHVWEIDSGRRVHDFKNIGFGSRYSLSFSHSGKQLAGMANSLHVIDISGEQKLRWVQVHDNVQTCPRSMVWSPDDTQIW